MSNRQDDALPELPEPWDPGVAFLTPEGVFEMPVFTADQMRAYAQSAIASLQARLDAAEADAARWRFMADTKRLYLGPVIGDRNGAGVRYIIAATCLGYVPKTVETIDAAVDAEMARKR